MGKHILILPARKLSVFNKLTVFLFELYYRFYVRRDQLNALKETHNRQNNLQSNLLIVVFLLKPVLL